MTDGEVAVRQDGTTTAVAAPSLDGRINIDLDADTPHVGVPPDTDVRYEDIDDDADDEDARTDGGVANRVDVTSRGFGLGDEFAMWSAIAGGLAIAGGGYLMSTPTPLLGALSVAAGGLLGYVGVRSYGGGDSA